VLRNNRPNCGETTGKRRTKLTLTAGDFLERVRWGRATMRIAVVFKDPKGGAGQPRYPKGK